ncbi:hypothetical protein KVR01_007723 [Diaporthe batatas]|uniref:uncharacterized protein n=1 Tax=Diaporthe batatas TaxID=748121 RepID=UPI001D056119|nr:uncharacterized protein KVR01_007723 [Diaporthe batatas]KAG8161958.1 hypothetical protein KVR01_007723 [Diaporthe batatas]
MSKQIVIIGAGFAGLWSALSAKRLLKHRNEEDKIKVLVIAPEPYLARIVHVQPSSSSKPVTPIGYDRLILAAGSSINRPKTVAGLREFAFDVDSLDSATQLEEHLNGLASLSESPARNTVVVCGGGFTGIELAAELPNRLLGHIANSRVILVESADEIGPELGPGPRPAITQAMNELGIQVKTGAAVSSVSAKGVTLTSGEHIESMTAIWTAGVVATPLAQQINGPKDSFGRLHVDQYLRTPSTEHVFATGDAARALADSEGHYALMSCQHALQLGRVSGHNAAADLLGEPMLEYSQETYACCLDLGLSGAVIGRGWGREVGVTGQRAKRVKEHINRNLIYPPSDASQALDLADPVGPDADELPLLEHILEVVG